MRQSAQLLVSELVTNAVVHARSDVTVVLSLTVHALRIEVSDDDPTCPQARDAHDSATGGRGLRIVDTVASRWGVLRHDGGKTVWFELTH